MTGALERADRRPTCGFTFAQIELVIDALAKADALVDKAQRATRSYTHLQRAQPALVATWPMWR